MAATALGDACGCGRPRRVGRDMLVALGAADSKAAAAPLSRALGVACGYVLCAEYVGDACGCVLRASSAFMGSATAAATSRATVAGGRDPYGSHGCGRRRRCEHS